MRCLLELVEAALKGRPAVQLEASVGRPHNHRHAGPLQRSGARAARRGALARQPQCPTLTTPCIPPTTASVKLPLTSSAPTLQRYRPSINNAVTCTQQLLNLPVKPRLPTCGVRDAARSSSVVMPCTAGSGSADPLSSESTCRAMVWVCSMAAQAEQGQHADNLRQHDGRHLARTPLLFFWSYILHRMFPFGGTAAPPSPSQHPTNLTTC